MKSLTFFFTTFITSDPLGTLASGMTSFYKAIPPARTSAYSTFRTESTSSTSSLADCSRQAILKNRYLPDFGQTALKYDKNSKVCTVGKLPSFLVQTIKREAQIVETDDPEVIYVCKNCLEPEAISYNIIAFPGYPAHDPGHSLYSSAKTTEIINVLNSSKLCSADMGLLDKIGGVNMRIDDSILFCGKNDKSCVLFSLENKTTVPYPESILELRNGEPPSLRLDYNHYWIPGGLNQSTSFPVSYTEYFKDGKFSRGPDLPFPWAEFCTVSPEPDLYFFTGGLSLEQLGGSNITMTVDVKTYEWTSKDSLINQRYRHACGLVSNHFGEVKVIVAGGIYFAGGIFAGVFQSNVEILDWHGDQRWREGPKPLSYTIWLMSSLQYDHYFYMTGGNTISSGYLGVVYNCTFTEECVVVPGLQIGPRDGHDIYAIENRFASCTP